MPDARLIGLVASLRSSAEAALGGADSPVARSLEREGLARRRTAERALSLLEMLAEKTRGNLDETEDAALRGALTAVRDLLERSGPSAGRARGAGSAGGERR
jgi:hypothetical protein